MIDEAAVYPSVDISKINVAGEELAGATLTLTGIDADQNPITFSESAFNPGENAQFVSDGESLVFVSGSSASTVSNLPDGTYILHEETAPTGYVVATDITFTIENGVVTGSAITAATTESNAICTMIDEAEEIPPVPTETPAPTATPVPTEEVATPSPTPTPADTRTVTSVEVDGTRIDPTKYVIEEDNSVSISTDATRVLSDGRHRVVVNYSDGSTTTSNIQVSDDTVTVVATGEAFDPTDIIVAFGLIAAAAFILKIRKKAFNV